MSEVLSDPKIISGLLGAIFGFFGGLLSPFIKTALDERSHKRKFEFESAILKQDNMISQQVNLLENLASVWHSLSSMASQVTFYAITREGFRRAEQDEYFRQAVQRYQNEGWVLLEKFRNEIRRTKHLVSEEVYRDLMYSYLEFEEVDARILHMTSEDNIDPRYANELHHKVHQEIPEKIGEKIAEIASLLGMSVRNYALGQRQD